MSLFMFCWFLYSIPGVGGGKERKMPTEIMAVCELRYKRGRAARPFRCMALE
jgi:hypothetical protein